MSDRNLPSEMGRGMSEKVRRHINGYVEHAPRDIEFAREAYEMMTGETNRGRGNSQPLTFDDLELISDMMELEYTIYHIVDSLDLPIPRSSDKRLMMWGERILLAKKVKDLTDNGYQVIMPHMKWGRIDIHGILERSHMVYVKS